MLFCFENAAVSGSDRPQLRLILKVGGGSSTPEADQSDNSMNLVHRQTVTQSTSYIPYGMEEESRNSYSESGEKERHKKKKEKKKKKNKDKDKEKDKERKKHKHHKVQMFKINLCLILQACKFNAQEKKNKEKDEPLSGHEDSMHYEVVSVQPSKVFSPGTSSAASTRPILKISTTPSFTAQTSESGASSIPSFSTPNSRGLRTSLRPRQERPALQKLLDLLLPSLERKDPRQFFAWPVTDSIAPGYSTIITKPMDFSTMKLKIEENEYKTLHEFTVMNVSIDLKKKNCFIFCFSVIG